jgi:hypothetical protein
MTIDAENDILYIAVNNEGIYQLSTLPTMAKNPTPLLLIQDNQKYFSKSFGGMAYAKPTSKCPTGSLMINNPDNSTFWRLDLSAKVIVEQLFVHGQQDFNDVKKSMVIKPLYGSESQYILSDNDNNGEGVKLIH